MDPAGLVKLFFFSSALNLSMCAYSSYYTKIYINEVSGGKVFVSFPENLHFKILSSHKVWEKEGFSIALVYCFLLAPDYFKTDLLKVNCFAWSELSYIKFCAELYAKIAIKNTIFKKKFKNCANNMKKCLVWKIFIKSIFFAQILENFARTWVRLSVRFRSSVSKKKKPTIPKS